MTPRQKRFAQEYLIDLNAHQAAIRAGYSVRSGHHNLSRLMSNPEVAAAIAQGMEERERRTQITADRVLRELARIAFADLSRYVDWGPEGVTLRPLASVSADDTAALAGIAAGSGPRGMGPRVKLHDKHRALAMLAKHLGLLSPSYTHRPPQDRHELARQAREIILRRLDQIAAAREAREARERQARECVAQGGEGGACGGEESGR